MRQKYTKIKVLLFNILSKVLYLNSYDERSNITFGDQ